MESDLTGKCTICGKPGMVHVTEINDGKKVSCSFCSEHVPDKYRDLLPSGPDDPAATEVTHLLAKVNTFNAKMKTLSEMAPDSPQRKAAQAEVDQLIKDIGAGNKQLGSTD